MIGGQRIASVPQRPPRKAVETGGNPKPTGRTQPLRSSPSTQARAIPEHDDGSHMAMRANGVSWKSQGTQKRRIEDDFEAMSLRRKSIVEEVVESEENFLLDLESLLQGYFPTLNKMAGTDVMPNVSKSDIKQILGNVEQLVPLHRCLVGLLEEKLANWHNQQTVGDAFQKIISFFKIYKIFYKSCPGSLAALEKCQKDNQFKLIEEEISISLNKQKLETLIVAPAQRIPRYILFLERILSKTQGSHPEYDQLSVAIKKCQEILEFGPDVLKTESVRRIWAMMKYKGGAKLMQGPRVLIHEGTILTFKRDENAIKKRLSKTRENKVQLWLFNDVIVHVKTSKSKKNTDVTERSWPLELTWLRECKDSEDTKNPHAFALIGPLKLLLLKFPSIDQKTKWFNHIRAAIANAINTETAPDEEYRYGTYSFPKEAGKYEGWWLSGRIHGEGSFSFFGNKYFGEWEHNKKHGMGTLECLSGEVFRGEWRDDKPNGYGRIQYVNQDSYEGEWQNGFRCGRGTMLYSKGDLYEGEWKENLPSGEGFYTTTNGFIYKGGWNYGKPHGFGMIQAPNGRRYEGQFKDGTKHGEGKMDYANGDFYIGQWKDEKPNGSGIFHSSTDGLYEGQMHNGMKEGTGKMLFRNGDAYEGSWKRNLYHGFGNMICASGAIENYTGDFETGKMSGKGELVYRSGSRYEGQFKDDLPHGTGTLISSQGIVFEGRWEYGSKEGKATIAVGPSKHTEVIRGGMMFVGQKSFLVPPDVPAIHLEL